MAMGITVLDMHSLLNNSLKLAMILCAWTAVGLVIVMARERLSNLNRAYQKIFLSFKT
jgi:hypothetical protein